MSVRGAAPNFPSTRPGGPRFGNFANNSGFPPMGPNQNPQGMRGPPPPYQSPGQFDPSFMSSNPGGANRQNPMGPHMMGVPREMNPMQRMPGPRFMGQGMPSGLPQIDPGKEVWVETKADTGKIYYYHAKTRQSVWKTPVEENVQIITQNEAQALAAGMMPNFGMGGPSANREQQGEQMDTSQAEPSDQQNPDSGREGMLSQTNDVPRGNMENWTRGNNNPDATKETTEGDGEMISNDDMPSSQQMNSGGMNVPGSRPAGQPPMGPPSMVMGGRMMAPHVPMPMMMGPPGQMMPGAAMPGMPGFPHMPFPGIMPRPLMGNPIMPASTVWRAHNAPDGRTYFYNITTMETQWNKPKELEEFEEAAKRTMEIEAKKAKEREQRALEHMNARHEANKLVASGNSDSVKQSNEALSEEDKKKLKQRPVATEAVPGTPWCVVWTGDEKVFFYNPTTRLSMWVRPDELYGRTDIDKILADPPHKRKKPEEKETPAPAEPEEETSDDNDELSATSKKQKKRKLSDSSGESHLSEAIAKNIAAIPTETRIKQFKEMLQERQVSAFSTWDKELHKIVFDARYTLLTPKERRVVFDDYLKTRAEEERKEKKALSLKTKQDFKTLLAEVNVSARMTFSEFASKHGRDTKFKAVERMREREALFNEFIQESKRKKTTEAKNKLDKIKADYLALLEEKKTEKYSRWSRVKEKISSDPRYSALDNTAQREEFWTEYCEKKNKPENDEEAERKRRTEESMKARLEQVEKEKAERSKEIDSERQKHRLEEAVQHFKALLADMVRNTDQSWSEIRRQLRKEHRWELASLLSKEEKERYFDEHIEALNKRKRVAFKQLLNETSQIDLTTTWKEIKKLIKEDPRYTKFSSSDRKREREFEDFIKEKKVTAKSEFRNLLRETKTVSHKSKELAKANPHYLNEIVAVLENDKRYLVLDCVSDERDDLLYTYMDELHRKGPPPPPTATEPSRRSLK